MSDPVTQALMRLVEQSTSAEEMTRRVIQSFGEGKLAQARQLAADSKGLEWARHGSVDRATAQQVQSLSFSKQVVGQLRRAPSLVVLLIGVALLILVFLWPPFIVPLPEGLVNNAGFAFILSPPSQGNLTPVVNTPLLALLAACLVAATVAVYFVVLRIERSLAMQVEP